MYASEFLTWLRGFAGSQIAWVQNLITSPKTPLGGIFLGISVFAVSFGASITLSNTPAWRFPERAIGPAVLEGKDPSGRLLVYSIILFLGFVISIFVVWLSSRLDRYFTERLGLSYSLIQKRALTALSMALSFVVFLGLINGPRQLGLVLELLGTWLSWLAIWNWLIAFQIKTERKLSILIDNSFQLCLFILPALFYVAFCLGQTRPLSIQEIHVPWYWLIVAGETILVMIMEKSSDRTTLDSFRNAVILGTAPLILLLPGAFLGNEIQWLLVPQQIALVSIYRSILAVTFSLAGVFFLYGFYTKRFSSRQCHRLTGCWMFPNIILFLVFSFAHRHTLPLDTLDYLHDGNLVVPAQQLIDHGRLPFIDAWYPRNLRDMLVGLLNFIFSWNYEPLGAMLWTDLLVNSASALVAYGILAILFCPLGAFLCALVFPTGLFFSMYYPGSVFPCLFTFLLLRKPNMIRLAVFWLVSLFSFAWMASDGSAAIPAGMLLVASLALLLPEWRNSVSWRAFILVFGTAALLYFAILLAKGHSIIETLRLIQAFTYVDSLIGSYSRFNDGLSAVTLIQYGIFPFVAIALAILALHRIHKTQSPSITGMTLFLLAVASLFLFKRAFARHCLIEGLQDNYFWASSVFLVLMLFGSNRRGIFAAFLAICLIVGVGYRTWEPFLKPRILFSPREWSTTEERIILNPTLKQRFLTIKELFDRTLAPEQTFAELANAHLIYSLVRRPYAFFHHSVQILQSDPAQAVYLAQWQRKLKGQGIPLVVTRLSNWWGSTLDEMPLGLSVYRLSEFLYQNYEPYASLEGLEIWKQKGFAAEEVREDTATVAPLHLPQTPAYASNDVVIDGNVFHATGPDPYVVGILEEPGSHLLPGEQYAIRILYRSTKAGPWTINPMTRKGDSLSGPTYEFLADASENVQSTGMVPSHVFRKEDFADFRVDIPDNSTFEIISIEAYPGIKPGFGKRIQTICQDLNMKLLPYVWANYDSKSSIQERRTLHTLQSIPAQISSTQTISLEIPEDMDKTTGNYLFLQAKGQEGEIVDLRLYDGKNSGVLHFQLKGNMVKHSYLIRISSLWVWYTDQPLHMEVSTADPRPIEISSATIMKGD